MAALLPPLPTTAHPHMQVHLNGVGSSASKSCTIEGPDFDDIPDYCTGGDGVTISNIGSGDNGVSVRSANTVQPRGAPCVISSAIGGQTSFHSIELYSREIYNLCVPPDTKDKMKESCRVTPETKSKIEALKENKICNQGECPEDLLSDVFPAETGEAVVVNGVSVFRSRECAIMTFFPAAVSQSTRLPSRHRTTTALEPIQTSRSQLATGEPRSLSREEAVAVVGCVHLIVVAMHPDSPRHSLTRLSVGLQNEQVCVACLQMGIQIGQQQRGRCLGHLPHELEGMSQPQPAPPHLCNSCIQSCLNLNLVYVTAEISL